MAELQPEMPGHPMPEAYCGRNLAHLKLPDQPWTEDNRRYTKTELALDIHGQNFLCFMTKEDQQYERWLMAPVHPDKLERTLRGQPVMSAVVNAEFLVVQSRNKHNPRDVRTSLVTLNEHTTGQEQDETLGNGIPSRIRATELQILDWRRKVEESGQRLGW